MLLLPISMMLFVRLLKNRPKKVTKRLVVLHTPSLLDYQKSVVYRPHHVVRKSFPWMQLILSGWLVIPMRMLLRGSLQKMSVSKPISIA